MRAFTSVLSPRHGCQALQLCSLGLQNVLGLVLSCGLERMGKELCSSSLSYFRHFYTSSCFSESCGLRGILSCLTVSYSHSAAEGWVGYGEVRPGNKSACSPFSSRTIFSSASGLFKGDWGKESDKWVILRDVLRVLVMVVIKVLNWRWGRGNWWGVCELVLERFNLL